MFPNRIFPNGTNIEHREKLGRHRVQIPAQAFSGFVPLGKLLNLSEPLFPNQSCDLICRAAVTAGDGDATGELESVNPLAHHS